MREFNDLLGLLAVLLQFSGVGAVSMRAYLLRRRQAGKNAFGRGGLLIVFALAWLALSLADVNTIYASVGNGLDDIPFVTTMRVALLGLWLWVLQDLLMSLAKEKLQ